VLDQAVRARVVPFGKLTSIGSAKAGHTGFMKSEQGKHSAGSLTVGRPVEEVLLWFVQMEFCVALGCGKLYKKIPFAE
jgi:hypothetical protein